MGSNCSSCGRYFDNGDDFARHRLETNFRCGGTDSSRHGSRMGPETWTDGGHRIKKISDGYLVGMTDHDIDDTHWHISPYGVVMSVKINGQHYFRHTDVSKKIREVCPDLDINFLTAS